MDAAVEIQRVASTQRDGGTMWRRGDDDVFSRSPSRGDDEEALRWAALQRLPTYDRAILADVELPGDCVGRALLDRIRVAGDGNGRCLQRLKDRIDRVGMAVATMIEVRFEHLAAEAEVRGGGVPTVLNSIGDKLGEAANALRLLPSRKRTMHILHDVSGGIIKPRRMTLLPGPPGSGKTTLLLALAGRLDKGLKVSGKVTYNGHGLEEFVPERTAACISQQDLHIGEMTVRETLAFSARCQGFGSRFDMVAELLRREKEANIKPDADIDAFMKASAIGGQEANVVIDYVLKILGLEICADTMVGDEMLRGISGGQRKRVTTGEMLVGPARALFMDEISNGLDSSTTFRIVNSLRESIHILGGTAVISLLQPAPETYSLLDDILLLSNGQIVYQGPRENVLEFFESMGFRCPERKGVADFLQEVTSRKDQKQYWSRRDRPYGFVPVMEFVTTFKSLHTARSIEKELAVPLDKTNSHPADLTATRYGVSGKELLKANIDREILPLKRNSTVYVFRTFQLELMPVITMTLFLRTEMRRDSITNGGIYMGALFFGLRMISFNGFSELILTVCKLPIFFKQRDLCFYPAWAYTLPSWILKIPITFIEVGGYVLLTYSVIGFDPNIGRFFKEYLLLLALNRMAGSLFLFLGGAARNMIVANILASFVLLVCVVMSGFILKRDKINKWWIWAYWISQMMHAQNAISVNEMLGHSWKKTLNSTASNETLGIQVLKSHGMFTGHIWHWIGIAAMIGFTILFNVLFTVSLEYLSPYGNSWPSVSEEELKEKHADMRGEVLHGRNRPAAINSEVDSVAVKADSAPNPKGMGLQGVSKINDGYNPATWMLELRNKALVKELSQPTRGSSDLRFPTQYSQSLFRQCMACLWKQNLSYWRNARYNAVRNARYNAVRFFFTTVVALRFGTMVARCKENAQDLFNALGSMYAVVLFIGVMNCNSVQPVVTVERMVFYPERAAGMYSAFPYAFGQSMTPNYHIASIVASAFDALWNLFSGFLIPWPFRKCQSGGDGIVVPRRMDAVRLVMSRFGDVMTLMDDGTPVMVFVEDYFDLKRSWLRLVAAVVIICSPLCWPVCLIHNETKLHEEMLTTGAGEHGIYFSSNEAKLEATITLFQKKMDLIVRWFDV
ncbi:hypothetical protein ACP70R_026973 [Stipagrostis hirtigluma subsp. patula]